MIHLGLPTVKGIFAPPGGWKPSTLYLVEVSFSKGNPIHHSYLMVGFLSPKNEPGAYTQIWNNSYEEPSSLQEVYYLKVIQELHTKEA